MAQQKVLNFLNNLADALQEFLPNEWVKEDLPNPRMLKKYSWGYGAINIQTGKKGFPSCHLFLNYGISHDCLTPVLEKIYDAEGLKIIRGVNQFGTDTNNCKLNPNVSSVFVEDYNNCNYFEAVSALMENSLTKLDDYFERFSELLEIRNALINRDKSLCFGDRIYGIAAVDYILNDTKHLFWFRQDCVSEHDWQKIDRTTEILNIKLFE